MKTDSLVWNLRESADAVVMRTEGAIDPDTGEVDDISADDLSLEGVEFEKLVGAAGSACRQLAAKAAIYKAEAKHYTDKAKQIERAVEKLKCAVKTEMERLQMGKVDGPWGTATIQKSAPAVNLTGDVPDEFMVVPEPKPNKKMIADYIKQTGDISFAELTHSTHIRFR